MDTVALLKSVNDKRLSKYRRNYRRYYNSRNANIDDIANPGLIGLYQSDMSIEDDNTMSPDVNVIKSCIDTLVSKIAQSKVRPYFNCINGSFKDIQIVKQAQHFFDLYYDSQNVNKIVSNAFRDACIFDTGYIFVDSDTQSIKRALPWQVYLFPSETFHGKNSVMYYEQKDFPVSLLPEKIIEKLTKKQIADLEQYRHIKFCQYFDTCKKLKVYYISEISYWQIEDNYEATSLPIVALYYNEPVLAGTSASIVDMLFSIQSNIDMLMARIKDASQLNPAQTFFVPKGSDIKVGQLNNRVGNVVTYTTTPNMTGVPVMAHTPDFISGQYMQLIDQLKETAYELVGISQLSAQSQKPTGLNSGIALQTMENIESDRFETQLNQIVKCYVDIAKTCINVFDKNANILPEEKNRVEIKWKDIIAERDRMMIQFSGADQLSKDPATKLEQLQNLAQSGIIPPARVAQFMEIPDLQGGYSLSNNAVNAVMTVIDKCIKENDFEVDDFIPFTLLKEEIINTQLSLKAADAEKNKGDIDKLSKLYSIVEEKEQQWTTTIEEGEEVANQAGGDGTQYGNVVSQEAGMQQVSAGAANAPTNEAVQGMSIGDSPPGSEW